MPGRLKSITVDQDTSRLNDERNHAAAGDQADDRERLGNGGLFGDADDVDEDRNGENRSTRAEKSERQPDGQRPKQSQRRHGPTILEAAPAERALASNTLGGYDGCRDGGVNE